MKDFTGSTIAQKSCRLTSSSLWIPSFRSTYSNSLILLLSRFYSSVHAAHHLLYIHPLNPSRGRLTHVTQLLDVDLLHWPLLLPSLTRRSLPRSLLRKLVCRRPVGQRAFECPILARPPARPPAHLAFFRSVQRRDASECTTLSGF